MKEDTLTLSITKFKLLHYKVLLVLILLTIEGVYIQQHGAFPLVRCPLQLGGWVGAGSGSWEVQRCQQFVLAQ